MAQVPTIEETTRAIYAAMSTYNVRAGTSVPMSGVQMKLHPEYKADDLNAAINDMLEQGLIELGRGGDTIKLTDAGFAEM